jgi:hypothetical protein
VNYYLILCIADFGFTHREIVAVVEADTEEQALSIIEPYVGSDGIKAVPLSDWLYNPISNHVGKLKE